MPPFASEPKFDRVRSWLLPLLFAGLLSGVTLSVWLTLDHFGVPLQQLGWPFRSLIWCILLMGLSGFIFGQAYHEQQVRRAAAMEDPVDEDETEELHEETLPEMPVLTARLAISRRRTESVGDLLVDVFDLTTETADENRVTRTIVLLPAAGLPPFELRPAHPRDYILAWIGVLGLKFDERAAGTLDLREVVSQFTATYRLTLDSTEAMVSGTAQGDEEAVRRVFTLRTMKKVLARKNWRLESYGGYLACWEAEDALGPKRREQLVTDAVELRKSLLAAHHGLAGEPVAAPEGTAPALQQAARLQAALLGGVLGAFAGFFAAGLMQVGEVFGPGEMGIVFPATIIGGGLLCGTVGLLLPLRRPLLQKPKDERQEKVVGCAILVGLFGGFLAGGIIGFMIGELIGLKIGDHKPRQLIFFGCIIAGVFLGPVTSGVSTYYLYRWISGNGYARSKIESDSEQ